MPTPPCVQVEISDLFLDKLHKKLRQRQNNSIHVESLLLTELFSVYLKDTGLPSTLFNALSAGEGSDMLKYIFAAFVVPKS